MQATSVLAIEPQAGTPVKVVSAPGPLEDQKRFNQLITRCAYQLYINGGCRDGHAMNDWLEAEARVLCSDAQVPVGFIDLNGILDVEACVGDIRAEDLEVSVEPFRVTIRGDRGKSERAQSWSRIGEEPHPIFKILSLPVEVDPLRTTADLNHGMLHVVLPKAAKARARTKAA